MRHCQILSGLARGKGVNFCVSVGICGAISLYKHLIVLIRVVICDLDSTNSLLVKDGERGREYSHARVESQSHLETIFYNFNIIALNSDLKNN